MRQVFQQRRRHFLQACSRYLRYVLNDHFVLVLLVLFGFLALQYRQLLQNAQEQRGLAFVLLGIMSLLILFIGPVGTYMEEADQVFLLPKEEEVSAWLEQRFRVSFFLWAGLQVFVQILFSPLYLTVGIQLPWFLFYLVILTVLKFLWMRYSRKNWKRGEQLDWEQVLVAEKRRQQRILQFFSLFTQVKGISGRVHRRSYLDGLLSLVSKDHQKTWEYLYLRAFLRGGDYFWLTLRLSLLSLASLLFIGESWLAVGLALVFDYLLLFQLLGLYRYYDYHYLTQLYPLTRDTKKQHFQAFLQKLLTMLLLLECVVALICLSEKLAVLGLVVGGLVLDTVYLKWKSEKLID